MNVILFQFLTLCSINIILASCLVYYSNKGIFGKFFRDMFKYDNKFEYIALLITSCIVLNMIYSIINIYIFNDYVINCMMNNTNTNTNSVLNPIQDPIRFWPSGVPQTWGVIGAAALAYRGVSGTPRIKAVAAIGTLGITVPTMLVSQAIDNPHGFHAFMYSLIYYKNHGIWPPTIPTLINKIISNSRRGNSFIEISSDVLNNVDTDIIINYGGIILIVWGLIGIFTMYLGNYLIEKFELKGRYYWLDKIIDIRTKIFPYFVKYEIFWIITILLIMIIYNLI